MLITVIICTYNRSESLKDTLNSLIVQEGIIGFDFEIVVVDNNSNDRTMDIVKTYMTKSYNLVRYIFEPEQGLSHARNAGIKAAKGDILAFTDDDVIVRNDYIMSIGMVHKEYDSDCVFGKILPLWSHAKIPIWLKRDKRLWKCLGYLDYGEQHILVTNNKHQFYGANFSIKLHAINKIGYFDINLGIKGNVHYLGEESDYFAKLLSTHSKIVYSPKMVVYHKVKDSDMTKSYFLKWHYEGGQSFPYKTMSRNNTIFNVPLWFFKEALLNGIRLMYYVLCLDSINMFWYELKAVFYYSALIVFIKGKYLCKKLA